MARMSWADESVPVQHDSANAGNTWVNQPPRRAKWIMQCTGDFVLEIAVSDTNRKGWSSETVEFNIGFNWVLHLNQA